MPGYSPFEGRLVKLINDYFEQATDCIGLAQRLKQPPRNAQFLDVIVDSPNRAYYLGIECKSISPPANDKVYFSKFSVNKKGVHQVDRITDFIRKTGRFGIMAIEIKGTGRGNAPNSIFLVPWHQVDAWFHAGFKGIDPNDLAANGYPVLKKEKGVLNFEYCCWQLRQL